MEYKYVRSYYRKGSRQGYRSRIAQLADNRGFKACVNYHQKMIGPNRSLKQSHQRGEKQLQLELAYPLSPMWFVYFQPVMTNWAR